MSLVFPTLTASVSLYIYLYCNPRCTFVCGLVFFFLWTYNLHVQRKLLFLCAKESITLNTERKWEFQMRAPLAHCLRDKKSRRCRNDLDHWPVQGFSSYDLRSSARWAVGSWHVSCCWKIPFLTVRLHETVDNSTLHGFLTKCFQMNSCCSCSSLMIVKVKRNGVSGFKRESKASARWSPH